MSPEWQPGDVAVLTGKYIGGKRVTRLCSDEWLDSDGETYESRCEARPLVVIDPEDRAQVRRLAQAILGQERQNAGRPYAEDVTDALRSLIALPKPEEPTGLGAGVEDAEGRLWVRVQTPGASEWLRVNSAREGDHFAYRHYTDIDAVKVLGQGWSE